MNLKKLKELLAKGLITQEEYDEMAKHIDDGVSNEPPEPGSDPEDKNKDKKRKIPDDEDEFQEWMDKMIQSAVDRATNKLGNENKTLRDKLEKERKKNLTAEELKAVEIQEKEQELQERERTIKENENRMYAMKALRKIGLDDGGEDALSLVDFVMGEDEAVIDSRVKSLKTAIEKRVKAEVDKVFGENGRNPSKGNAGAGGDNPWSKATFNLTKQMEIELKNPELAKSLKASAI